MKVVLPKPLDGRASMTMLRHYAGCPRSGFFYAAHKNEDGASIEMVRGSALHEVAERAVGLMVANGEATIPDDLLKTLVADVLGEMPVPWEEHDYLRECAYRWSRDFTCDPAKVICCETLIVLDVGGWEVRCKIDFAESRDQGMAVYVADWKSSRAAPGFEEIGRKRPDGSIAAKQFQLVLYALALAFGVPVRVSEVECDDCGGTGSWLVRSRRDEPIDGETCPECEGEGVVRTETREPFPLAGQAERFDLELVFPGMEAREGGMVRRLLSLTRLELGEYRESLAALLGRLEKDEKSGEWPAVQSDAACSECPCKRDCPIPTEMRTHAGVINTYEEACEAAEVLDREGAKLTALKSELRSLAKAHGWEIRYGLNKSLQFVYGESDRIEDKEGMFAAVERSVRYGEPFDRSRFVRTVGASNFKVVTVDE